MAKTILRIEKGFVLTPELRELLQTKLQDTDLETVEYTNERDLKAVYQRRIESLAEAFQLIVKSYSANHPEHKTTAETLKHYAQHCLATVNLGDEDDLATLQNKLSQYTLKLCEALAYHWQWPEGDPAHAAIEQLNKAEQYVIAQHDAAHVATLTTLEVAGKPPQVVLQYDRRLGPVTERLEQELQSLKDLQVPKTPEWLRELIKANRDHSKDACLAYFCFLPAGQGDYDALVTQFKDFRIKWDSLKTQPDLAAGLETIKSNKGVLPLWFSSLNKNEQEFIRVCAQREVSIDRELDALNKFITDQRNNDGFKNSLSLLTSVSAFWYWFLDEAEQAYLKDTLERDISISKALPFLSSRLRTIPGLANLRAHHLTVFTKGETGSWQQEDFPERLASSHMASRDVRHMPAFVKDRHVTGNLQTLLQMHHIRQRLAEPSSTEAPLLIQTLISPSWLLEILAALPDNQLYRDLKGATVGQKFVTNHPFNKANKLFPTSPNDTYCLAILNAAKAEKERHPGLMPLIEAYQDALKVNQDQLVNQLKGLIGREAAVRVNAMLGESNKRELFLSSLEHLMIIEMGGTSYGSCISGKDRKSIELIHTNAMLLYRRIYDKWPRLEDTGNDRDNFVQIVAKLYCSGHHQLTAGQSATGSDGIKTPEVYWPADIAKAIKQRSRPSCLDEDERMATNNEVKNISKGLSRRIDPEGGLFDLKAMSLSPLRVAELLAAIKIVIEDEDQLFGRTLPTGINAIKSKVSAEKEPWQLLAEIFEEVHTNRQGFSWSRGEYASKFYTLIEDLFKAPNDKQARTTIEGLLRFNPNNPYIQKAMLINSEQIIDLLAELNCLVNERSRFETTTTLGVFPLGRLPKGVERIKTALASKQPPQKILATIFKVVSEKEESSARGANTARLYSILASLYQNPNPGTAAVTATAEIKTFKDESFQLNRSGGDPSARRSPPIPAPSPNHLGLLK